MTPTPVPTLGPNLTPAVVQAQQSQEIFVYVLFVAILLTVLIALFMLVKQYVFR